MPSSFAHFPRLPYFQPLPPLSPSSLFISVSSSVHTLSRLKYRAVLPGRGGDTPNHQSVRTYVTPWPEPSDAASGFGFEKIPDFVRCMYVFPHRKLLVLGPHRRKDKSSIHKPPLLANPCVLESLRWTASSGWNSSLGPHLRLFPGPYVVRWASPSLTLQHLAHRRYVSGPRT